LESIHKVIGSAIGDIYFSYFSSLLIFFLFYPSFFAAIIDADGQGFCQGGFSIDFTKVCDSFSISTSQETVAS